MGYKWVESHIEDETRRLPTKIPCGFPHKEALQPLACQVRKFPSSMGRQERESIPFEKS